MKILIPALAAVGLSMSGCVIPYKYTMRQGASGVVRDDVSGAPIGGASVVVVAGKEEVATVTSPDGRFSVPAITKWGVYVVPMDPMGIPWSLTIRARDYRAYSSHLLSSVMQISVREVGEIRLRKEEPNQAPEPTAPSGRGSS